MNSPSIDEALNKAFNLASFILDDRETAIQTVEEAMARLDVTTAAQGKRLYYKPSLSSWVRGEKPERYRNKVLFGEMHLLQRLIYIASEVFERHKEKTFAASDAAEKRMIIHFIKHLVRITTRRNSFYVTLGINRLLYSYTTAETMETYNAVIQDPARVKDDYYYRSRKGVLMQELKKRFGGFINIARGARGEERFHASENQNKFSDVVRECLSFFTPWDTYCLVPAGVDPIVDGIPDLSSQGTQVEDKVEVDRIHAVLHPDCYGRLIGMLGLESPERKLEVPHFFLTSNTGTSGEGQGGARRPTSKLSGRELDEIKAHLDDQSARRKRDFAGMLRIIVDGQERARLERSLKASTRFVIEDDAEMIEVRAMVDGNDLLLASHLFSDREAAGNSKVEKTSIVLEGGQKVSISISVAENSADAVVDVEYRETGLLRTAVHLLKTPAPSSSASEPSRRLRWNPARVVPAIAIGLVFVLLTAFAITQFTRQGNSGSTQPQTASNSGETTKPDNATAPTIKDGSVTPPRNDEESPVASSQSDKPSQKSPDVQRSEQKSGSGSADTRPSNDTVARSGERQTSESVARNTEPVESGQVSPARNSGRDEPTRSVSRDTAVVRLSEVRNIYVEVIGDVSLSTPTRRQLITNLNRSNRFKASGSKDSADALLRLTVKSADGPPATMSVNVVLLNARGETIWQGANSRRVYTGSYESVATDIVKGLLDDAGVNPRR